MATDFCSFAAVKLQNKLIRGRCALRWHQLWLQQLSRHNYIIYKCIYCRYKFLMLQRIHPKKQLASGEELSHPNLHAQSFEVTDGLNKRMWTFHTRWSSLHALTHVVSLVPSGSAPAKAAISSWLSSKARVCKDTTRNRCLCVRWVEETHLSLFVW